MLYRNLYSHQVHYWKQDQNVQTKTKTRCTRPRPKLQDQDQDRHWSETGLVIRPRSQTTTLHDRQSVSTAQSHHTADVLVLHLSLTLNPAGPKTPFCDLQDEL